jgi:sulfatase modifying factor 1
MWWLILVLLRLNPALHLACPADMVLDGRTAVCVDRYEWPNRKGVRPAVAMTAVQSLWDREREDDSHNAEALCASVGKRLCRMEEWVSACKGKGGTDYPFGRRLAERKPAPEDAPCNYAQTYRERKDVLKVFRRDPEYLDWLDQSDPSGTRGCVSGSGAEDMMGNVEEWIRCPRWMSYSGANCVGEPGNETCYCLAGRYWSAPVKCHEVISGHSPEWHDYETGFRCCSDPEYVP